MTQRPPTQPPRNASVSHDDVVDDDGRRDAIPEPDDAASSSERMRAAQFASLLEDDAAGALPAALALEARHNLEMAVAVQAIAGHHQLDDAEANAMVANVLRNAMAPVVQTPAVDPLAAQRVGVAVVAVLNDPEQVVVLHAGTFQWRYGGRGVGTVFPVLTG